MDFREVPSNEGEFRLFCVYCKSNREQLWDIVHRWYKKLGVPDSMNEDHYWYNRCIYYIQESR